MKKIYIIIALLVMGNFAMAQTSVWHGGREVWTRGEGTKQNPYLIENADQLAMLSYAVSKGYQMRGVYFKLTTDIDLNGSEDQLWTPIGSGYYYEDGCLRKLEYPTDVFFSGNFDGGGHAISNIYVDNKNEAGLFGRVDDYSDTIRLENIRIVSGYIKGTMAGGIVGNARRYTMISDCYNSAEIHGFTAGGISGNYGFIERCYNRGKIFAEGRAGGITPMLSGTIRQCYNSGEVISESSIAGGIAGLSMVMTHVIENCYNTGAVTVLAPDSLNSSGCGGIVGCAMVNRIKLHNCYNVGNITGTDGPTGGIVGNEVVQDSVINCYYLNTCGAQGVGVAMDEDAMRTPDFVATLNDDTDVWAMDVNNTNFGFPILTGLDMEVDEVSNSSLTVYPNPTQGTLRIEGEQMEEVEVFNMLGVKVMQRALHCFNGTVTLDVSTLSDGLYLLRVADAQKAYRTCSFVVRH